MTLFRSIERGWITTYSTPRSFFAFSIPSCIMSLNDLSPNPDSEVTIATFVAATAGAVKAVARIESAARARPRPNLNIRPSTYPALRALLPTKAGAHPSFGRSAHFPRRRHECSDLLRDEATDRASRLL